MAVAATTAVLSTAGAAPVEGLHRKAIPVVVSDSRVAQAMPVQTGSTGTVVVIQPTPPELLARLDATNMPGALPWTNTAIPGNADPRATSQSFTVRGSGVALVGEEKTPALNWSAILATVLLVGFFLFRRT